MLLVTLTLLIILKDASLPIFLIQSSMNQHSNFQNKKLAQHEQIDLTESDIAKNLFYIKIWC
jgi:hypothetical protein